MSSDAALLARIEDQIQHVLAALGRIERNQSDPEEVRQAISDITELVVLTPQMAEVLGVARDELMALRSWRAARLSGEELQHQFEDLKFITQQLASISQHWRDDLLLMRSDIRRLATVTEMAMHALPTDDPEALPPEMRAILESRRSGRLHLNRILIALLVARERGDTAPDLTAELRDLESYDAATMALLRQSAGKNQGES